MARETKAQPIARQQQETFLQEQELSKSYHKRLMTVLEAATREGCGIGVIDGKFSVYTEGITLELGLDWTCMNEYALSDLQFQISISENVRAEERRKDLVRTNALQKLTKEERDLLGL